MKSCEKKLSTALNDIKTIRIVFVIAFFVITLLASWNCDDAYHGFVMSRNFAKGYGLVYNYGERVNVSTCPLFSIVLGILGIVFPNFTFLSFLVCTAFSTAAFAVVAFKFCKSRWQVLFLFFALISSYSFFTYTASGLENCMIYFLESVYLCLILLSDRFDAKRLFFISFVCSLILMTRMDAGIIIFLPTAYCFLAKRDCGFFKMIFSGILGLAPFFLWEAISVVYYGAFFPNTYYIKVNTGFEKTKYILNGLIYMMTSEIYDTCLAVFIIIALVMMLKTKQGKFIALAAGFVLKLFYLVWIGGDFMIGRHFSDIYFISIILIIFLYKKGEDRLFHIEKRKILFASLMLCTALSLIGHSIYVTEYIGEEFIADEKVFYSQKQSFSNVVHEKLHYNYDVAKNIPNIYEIENLISTGCRGDIVSWAGGTIAYYYNETVYLVDKYGLGDPLLSHLPAVETDIFRTGHMYREFPAGYRESIQTGENLIVDPSLHAYYDIVRYVISGQLTNRDRIKTSVKFALGSYDYLVDEYLEHINTAADDV